MTLASRTTTVADSTPNQNTNRPEPSRRAGQDRTPESSGRSPSRRVSGPGANSATEAAEGGRLGTYTNNSSGLDGRQARRRRRHDLRGHLWKESNLERVRKCGRVPRSTGVGIRLGAEGAGLSGLVACGSVWACPVCAAKIAAERASDLGQVLAWATNAGHTVALVTLTMRHRQGQRLIDCWDAAVSGWSRVTSGERWKGEKPEKYGERLVKWEADKAANWAGSRPRKRPERRIGDAEFFGVLGFARAAETTYGANGWHVHLHVVVVLEGRHSNDEERARALGVEMYRRWEAGLAKRGYTAMQENGGLDVRLAESAADALSAYLAKQLALEATHGHAKQGRNGSQTPFELLIAAVEQGDADALDRWHEWEQASEGRQQLTWSVGLREMAGLARQERTAEEIVEDDIGNDDLVVVENATWQQIRDQQTDLLDTAERDGLAGVLRWLNDRDCAYIVTLAGREHMQKSSPPSSCPLPLPDLSETA